MAFPVTINGRTYTLADFEGTNYVDGFPDALEDFVTQAGDIYNSTSSSSVAIGTGSKTFTIADSGKPYQAGTPLRIADAAAPETNFMDCIVTSYSGTTLVVDSFGYAGSGTKTSWTVNIGGAKTVDGTLAVSQGGTGATTAAAARTALGVGTGDSPTFAGIDVTGTVTADGLTVDGDATISGAARNLLFVETDQVDKNTRIRQNGGNLTVATLADDLSTATNRILISHSTGDISFYEDTGTTAKFFWDASAESLGIGTTSPAFYQGSGLEIERAGIATVRLQNTTTGKSAELKIDTDVTLETINTGSSLLFNTAATERMRIDSSGNLLVGKTAIGSTTDGFEARASGYTALSNTSSAALNVNRNTTDGDIVSFTKDGTTVGTIGTLGGALSIGNNTNSGILFNGTALQPTSGGTSRTDGVNNIGASAYRFNDVYATNALIQTSDANEKQDIEVLSEAEQRVAVAAKGLLRKFRWKDSVAEKGDDARIHFGIIAQDLQAAFEAEGLDAGDYAMFIHSTWTDEETGEERSRMGVRYSELLAFIIAAI